MERGLGVLKLTTASYWRPSGRNIHHRKEAGEDDDWGVRPDPPYEVIVEGEQRAELALQRHYRDAYTLPGENRPSTGPQQPEPLLDAQLEKAVQYVEQAAAGRP